MCLPIGGVVPIKNYLCKGTRYRYVSVMYIMYKKKPQKIFILRPNCSNKTKEIQSEILGKYAQI